MTAYPAVRDPGSIELLFKSIRSKKQPEKVTTDYLASIGFRRQPDIKLLELLFFLGFIDHNFLPSDLWRAIANTSDVQFRKVLEPAIAESYKALFQHQFDQESSDSKVIIAFLKKETGKSDTESAYMLLTLQVLKDLSGFNERSVKLDEKPAIPAPEEAELPEMPKTTLPDVSDEPAPGINNFANGVSLNITIPAEAMDAELLAMVKILIKKAQ